MIVHYLLLAANEDTLKFSTTKFVDLLLLPGFTFAKNIAIFYSLFLSFFIKYCFFWSFTID